MQQLCKGIEETVFFFISILEFGSIASSAETITTTSIHCLALRSLTLTSMLARRRLGSIYRSAGSATLLPKPCHRMELVHRISDHRLLDVHHPFDDVLDEVVAILDTILCICKNVEPRHVERAVFWIEVMNVHDGLPLAHSSRKHDSIGTRSLP